MSDHSSCDKNKINAQDFGADFFPQDERWQADALPDEAEILRQAVNIMLHPEGLDLSFAVEAAAGLGAHGLDFGELYFERCVHESFYLEEGIIKNGSFDIEKGVAARAVLGEKSGFAYSDILDRASIAEACRAACSISSGHSCERVNVGRVVLPGPGRPLLYLSCDPFARPDRAEKLKFLQAMDAAARSLGGERVRQVSARLSCSHKVILIVRSDGQVCADIKPMLNCALSVIMEEDGRRESGFAAAGGAGLFDELFCPRSVAAAAAAEGRLEVQLAREAVRTAEVNLQAQPGPAGTMPVVLAAGWPGVLIHEAVGHGLEADFNRTGSSVFSGRLGQQVASSCCTIVDNGALSRRRGSVFWDDEGTPGQCNVLIENGILRRYMQDRQNARLMGAEPTGNGRRQDYSCLPLPRMTNTYMLPGPYSQEEIISSVERGIFAVNFSGGQVDITSGRFVFCTSEAYLIEHGRVTAPIKNATLIGNGPEVMQQVSMVGSDLEFDHGIGVCGKAGQSVPVGIGQPSLKVDALTVGGMQAQ